MTRTTTIGTRGSELALWQTNWVHQRLRSAFPEFEIKIDIIKTKGDKILDVPLAKIGDKALFTKELDVAMLNGDIDIAVHSLKDLPTRLPDGICLAAVTERWDVRDAFVSKKYSSWSDLPQGATVATGSLRRRAQLLHKRPDLNIIDLRGNLNTRFKKFDESDWDAMILAVAGIERLGWGERISEKISMEVLLPAVGQGSFAITCREDDRATWEMLQALDHHESHLAALAERAMLRTLEGGCQIPIGAHAAVDGERLALKGCVCSLDGTRKLHADASGAAEKAEDIGISVAQELLGAGGKEILDEILKSQPEGQR